jgi:hypothetical protein
MEKTEKIKKDKLAKKKYDYSGIVIWGVGLILTVFILFVLPFSIDYYINTKVAGFVTEIDGGYSFVYNETPIEIFGKFIGRDAYYSSTGTEHFVSVIKLEKGYALLDFCPYYRATNYAIVDLGGNIESTIGSLEDKEVVYKMLSKHDEHFVELLKNKYNNEKIIIR